MLSPGRATHAPSIAQRLFDSAVQNAGRSQHLFGGKAASSSLWGGRRSSKEMKPAETRPSLLNTPDILWSITTQVAPRAPDRHIVILPNSGAYLSPLSVPQIALLIAS